MLGQIADASAHIHRLCPNVESVNFYHTLGRGEITRRNLHRRGFTRPIGTQEADDFTRLHCQRNLINSALLIIFFRKILDPDRHTK